MSNRGGLTDTTHLRELLAKERPGEWIRDRYDVCGPDGYMSLAACVHPNIAEITVALHNAAPALLDELDELRKELNDETAIRELVKSLPALRKDNERLLSILRQFVFHYQKGGNPETDNAHTRAVEALKEQP